MNFVNNNCNPLKVAGLQYLQQAVKRSATATSATTNSIRCVQYIHAIDMVAKIAKSKFYGVVNLTGIWKILPIDRLIPKQAPQKL